MNKNDQYFPAFAVLGTTIIQDILIQKEFELGDPIFSDVLQFIFN